MHILQKRQSRLGHSTLGARTPRPTLFTVRLEHQAAPIKRCIQEAENALTIELHTKNQINHLPRISSGLLMSRHFIGIRQARNFPSVGSVALGRPHAVDGNDSCFRESDPCALQDGSHTDWPAEDDEVEGDKSCHGRCHAFPVERHVVAMCVQGDWVAGVGMRLREVAGCGAHEGLDWCCGRHFDVCGIEIERDR